MENVEISSNNTPSITTINFPEDSFTLCGDLNVCLTKDIESKVDDITYQLNKVKKQQKVLKLLGVLSLLHI
jgi:hypothetical protein